jgi:PAS domain S-box-containing protein
MGVGDLHPAALPLRERLGDSPVIGWLKDLDGRYLYANRSYVEQLGVTEDRLVGRTDADLPAHEVIDGPRARDGVPPADEPIQLEYRVPAFEGRPELSVMRFAVRDHAGELIGVCGVASRIGDPLLPAVCGELMAVQDPVPSAPIPAVAPAPEPEPLVVPEELSQQAELATLHRELAAARARIAELEGFHPPHLRTYVRAMDES